MAGNDLSKSDRCKDDDIRRDDARRPSSDVSQPVPVPTKPASAGGIGLAGFMMDYLDRPDEWGHALEEWERTHTTDGDRSAGYDSMRAAGSDGSHLIISDSDESAADGNRFVENKSIDSEQH